MSCIVAIIENETIYMAGDSLVVNMQGLSYSKVSQSVQKASSVWVKDGMVCGGCGDARMLQLLRYEHAPSLYPYPTDQDALKYLVSTFIPSLQKCFTQRESRSDGIEGELLLSLEKQLFVIGADFQVSNPAWNCAAIGQGAPIAEGSLYTTEQLRLSPLPRLYLALLAAEHHTSAVGRPFMYITNEMTEPAILDERVML